MTNKSAESASGNTAPPHGARVQQNMLSRVGPQPARLTFGDSSGRQLRGNWRRYSVRPESPEKLGRFTDSQVTGQSSDYDFVERIGYQWQAHGAIVLESHVTAFTAIDTPLSNP